LRTGLICCAVASVWLVVPTEVLAGVMMSAPITSGEMDNVQADWVDDSRPVDLPWAQVDNLPLDSLSVPAGPVNGGADGGSSGSASGGPICGLPWVVCDVPVPQLVTCPCGEGMRFVPPAPTSDLLDPPRAAL
jgi:hypothetical protein